MEKPLSHERRSGIQITMVRPRRKKYAMERNYERVGTFLKEKRLAAGYLQIEVARKLGYNSSQLISNFEAGIDVPPLKKLAKMIELYKMSPAEVMDLIVEAEREVMMQKLKSLVKVRRVK